MFDFWGLGPDDDEMPWDEPGEKDMGRGIPPKHEAKWRSSEWAPNKEGPVEPGPDVQSDSRPTVWQAIMNGTADMRCRLMEVHIHDVLHALGLNPSAPWPPDSDELMEMFNGDADHQSQ